MNTGINLVLLSISIFVIIFLISGNIQDSFNDAKAVAVFAQETAIDPANTVALNSKGDALYDLEKYDEAIPNYDKVLATDPNDIDALNGKGDALYMLDKNDEAIQNYDKVLAIDPNEEYALDQKTSALQELDR